MNINRLKEFEPRSFVLSKLNVWEHTMDKDPDDWEGTEVIVSAHDSSEGGQVDIDVWEGPLVLKKGLSTTLGEATFLGNYEVDKTWDEADDWHDKLTLSFKNTAFLIEALTSVVNAFASSKYTVDKRKRPYAVDNGDGTGSFKGELVGMGF